MQPGKEEKGVSLSFSPLHSTPSFFLLKQKQKEYLPFFCYILVPKRTITAARRLRLSPKYCKLRSHWRDLERINRSNTNCQSWYHPSRNSWAIQWFQKGSETCIKSSISGPKYLCLLAQGIKLLGSQDPSHSGWAQGCAGLCSSWEVTFSFLRILCFSQGQLEAERCLQMPCTGLCRQGMKSSPTRGILPGKPSPFHTKSWEETWKSPAGVTPMLLKRFWLVLEATTTSKGCAG